MAEASRTEIVESLLRDPEVKTDPRRLDELIDLARQDVADPAEAEADRRWSNLGAALWAGWRAIGDVDMLRDCRDASRRAVDLLAVDGALRDSLRQNLLRVLLELHRATGDAQPLDEALEVLIAILPEPGEPGLPGTVKLAGQTLALAGAYPGSPRPDYERARRRVLAAYAELSLSVGKALVGRAAEDHDRALFQEGVQLLDEALEAPTEDAVERSRRIQARASAAVLRWRLQRRPPDLDDAIQGFVEALADAPEDDREAGQLRRDLAICYRYRYERDGNVADLSEAVRTLSAAPRGEGDAASRWDWRMRSLLWQRYQAFAELDDLDAAIEISRRLVAAGGVGDLSRDDAAQTLRHLLKVRLAYRFDTALANEILALTDDGADPDSFGRELPWTRTYEDGDDDSVVSDDAGGRRILFLHTFKDPAADVIVLRHLAAALQPSDRIVLLGDERDQSAVVAGVGARAEFVTTSHGEWRGTVHREIAMADAVVLHLTTKDLAFPRLSKQPDLAGQFPQHLWDIGPEAGPAHQRRVWGALREFTNENAQAFEETPLGDIFTGAGLLLELTYLDRLNALPRTVVVADNRHYFHLAERIRNAIVSSVGDVFTANGMATFGRVTALEGRLGVLSHSAGVTFSARPDGEPSPALVGALRSSLAQVIDGRPAMTPDERVRAAEDLPLGTSAGPRPLPPDGEFKVISATPVEDLVVIPGGELVEIPLTDMRWYFLSEVVEKGCPRCGGPFDELFFYSRGLSRPRLRYLANTPTYGKCQRCGRRSTVRGQRWLSPL